MPHTPPLARRAAALLAAAAVPALAPARARAQTPASACERVAGNLVVNCGFEGAVSSIPAGYPGGFVAVPAGYTVTFTPGGGYGGVSGGYAHSGTRDFYFGDSPPLTMTLAQALATTPGQAYQISFWAFSRLVAPTNSFVVTFGGVPVYDAPLPNNSYAQFTVTGAAAGASTVLAFTVSDIGYGTLLDDLSVTPLAATAVPEPGTWALLGAGLLAVGALARRRTAAG